MGDQKTSNFLDLPLDIRATIYGYRLPRNERIAFRPVSDWNNRIPYKVPLALRPRLEHKQCLSLLRFSRQIRSEVRNLLLPHITPVLLTFYDDPRLSTIGPYQGGLFSRVRCLEIQVRDTILEACLVLGSLPATVKHVKFHFDWRHICTNTRIVPWTSVTWIKALADLLVRKFQPEHKSINADLYLEQYLKTTALGPHDSIGCPGLFSPFLSQAEIIAIAHASMQTLHFPSQLQSITIVAPTNVVSGSSTRHGFSPLKYAMVSTEKDWLENNVGGLQLLRHKLAIVPSPEDGSAATEQQTAIKETFVKHNESVFRDQSWAKVGDLNPTYDNCHE